METTIQGSGSGLGQTTLPLARLDRLAKDSGEVVGKLKRSAISACARFIRIDIKDVFMTVKNLSALNAG